MSEQPTSRGRDEVADLLQQLGFADELSHARDESVLRRVGRVIASENASLDEHVLARLAFAQERVGIDAFIRFANASQPDDANDAVTAFRAAYNGWRAVAGSSEVNTTEAPLAVLPASTIALMLSEFPESPLDPEIDLALHLAAAGTLGNLQALVRLDLAAFGIEPSGPESPWSLQVATRVAGALVLLVRKGRGWRDVGRALEWIADLRNLQSQAESRFLASVEGVAGRQAKAAELVCWYHLAQMVTTAGEYLRDGRPSLERVTTRLDKHRDKCVELARAFGAGALVHQTFLIWGTCKALCSNSIWSHVAGLGERIAEFVAGLTAVSREAPVLELWPSQQKALQSNVLSTYHRAVLVEMPTSAGKTLLAKFSIVQAKSLSPSAVVVYLAPTRALVNQITLELRSDFRGLGFAVEQTVPAFELDPAEEALLAASTDVLVTTPEKLDLLVRKNHPVTHNISLIVADEAHGISDKYRGARLELLLGMLKRERAGARFLLLSPFLPRGEDLVRWLGDDRGLAPIVIDWKPSAKVVAAAQNRGSGRNRRLELETLPATDSAGVAAGSHVYLGPPVEGNSKAALSTAAVLAMRERGSVLVLCRGQGTAETRAAAIADRLEERTPSADLLATCSYLQAEAGENIPIAALLRKGVAYHHAGLSPEGRWLVESLIRSGDVEVVCGTTTLAAGVNFPITSVVVETLRKGDQPLEYTDFWNIAGRAGRAMVDGVGVVAFPSRGGQDREEYAQFLRGEAQAIASQLSGIIASGVDVSDRFDMALVERHPEFGSFMQFLAHAMRVAGNAEIAEDVEDLLRSTLVFRQAQLSDPSGRAAARLASIARSYLLQVSRNRGLLELADQTGFATPSVFYLQQRLEVIPGARNRDSWAPEKLFGHDVGPLASRIEAIAAIPEIRLGIGRQQPFSSRKIAAILADWVNGVSLGDLAATYPLSSPTDEEAGGRVARFSSYLFGTLLGKASWGLGALEGLCLAGRPEEPRGDESYIPSMVFFGVKSKEAVWLRMAGVPRIVADRLGRVWAAERRGIPRTYAEARAWVSSLDDATWQSVSPPALTPDALRRVWSSFSGEGAPNTARVSVG